MSQTLTSLLVHLVFSTKNREPLITPDVEPNLFAYIGSILKTINLDYSMPEAIAITFTC
jgi:REP-associated tyrosine transposase